MRVMTWNIDVKAMSRKRIVKIVSMIEDQCPEVLTLQEVGVGWEKDLESMLPGIGLK